MRDLARFSVSLPPDLLRAFDRLIRTRRYSNRSEFVRDLLRAEMARSGWEEEGGPELGVLSLVYDHHTPNLNAKLNEIQHRGRGSVTAALHVHLDRHHCLEVIVLRGRPREIVGVARQLIACRGVHHGELVPVTGGTGRKRSRRQVRRIAP
jgi:CopG family nickel-responsive transcriptional regulator